LLLDQGDVGTARTVLELAAEAGRALALFALAATYDPAVLTAWGTFGTQGDVHKAQLLYAEGFAGGIQEAKIVLIVSRISEPFVPVCTLCTFPFAGLGISYAIATYRNAVRPSQGAR
jgi:hypothetical protein